METQLSIYTLLTLYYYGHSSHLLYRNDILRGLTYEGKLIQYIPLSNFGLKQDKLQKRALSFLWLTKQTIMIAKRGDGDITSNITKSLVELLVCAKGHYNSLQLAGSANTH